jgi:RNA 2',3'-cyclic 3'-phosphodiesterase
MPRRLFVALWPDEETRQHCATISSTLAVGQARPVPAANMHVTLLFLGNIAPDTEAAFKLGTTSIAIPKINLCFDQISFWKKPRILCLTTSKPEPEAISLAAQFSELAKDLGILIENRPLTPHITLVKNASNLTPQAFEPVVWQSNSVCLVESLPNANGVSYRLVETWEAC